MAGTGKITTAAVKFLSKKADISEARARQVLDGDVDLPTALHEHDEQLLKLGEHPTDQIMSDAGVIARTQANETQLFQWKQELPDEQKRAVTDAEIAYKKGDPAPLAKLYKTLGATALVSGSALASEDTEAAPALLLKKGIDASGAGKIIRNKINREGGGDGKAVERFVHEQSNYDNGFTEAARKWDGGNNGENYVYGIKKMAHELIQGTDDPAVRKAVMGWLQPRLQRAAAATAGVGATGAAVAGESDAPPSIELSNVAMTASGAVSSISPDDQFEKSNAPSDRERTKAEIIADTISAIPEPEAWDNPTQFALKEGMRTVAGGLSLGHADEIEGGIRSLMKGTEYEAEVEDLRERQREFQAGNKNAAFALDIIPALATGGAVLKAGQKAGFGLGRTGAAEGAFGGEGYSEGEDKIFGAVLGAGVGAAAGKSIGAITDWASTKSIRPNGISKEGGKTDFDENLDEGILTQTIEPGSSIMYRVQGFGAKEGDLAEAKVLEVVREPKYDKASGKKISDGLVRIQAGNSRVEVPTSKIETVDVKGVEDQYERLRKYDNARNQDQTSRRKVQEEVIDKETGEVTMQERNATLRDATNVGEAWDAIKLGAKDLYYENFSPADDHLWRKVSKEVGARFKRANIRAERASVAAFTQIYEPLKPVAQLADDSSYFKAMLLDFTNREKLLRDKAQHKLKVDDPPTADDVRMYIRRELDDDAVAAWDDYLKYNKGKKAEHGKNLSGNRDYESEHHIHTQLKPKKKPKEDRNAALDELEDRIDGAMESRTRGSALDYQRKRQALIDEGDMQGARNLDGTNADDYMNPFFTDFRRTTNLDKLNELARMFSLKIPEGGVNPAEVFNRIEAELIERGIPKAEAALAAKVMRDDFIGGTVTPNNWLQALNSVGYAGSLAGPKSALLNLHDIGQGAVLYPGQLTKSVLKKGGPKVGAELNQNLGEFRNAMIGQINDGALSSSAIARDVTREGTDYLMKASGFAWLDKVGKDAITRMIIGDAVDNVDNLAKRWGFYFSKRELDLIETQIRKHGTDVQSMTGKGADLMEELFFSGLAQQQLISSSGRSSGWARNPNMRFMWALRGFAMKQQSLALKNVVEKIEEGKTKEALDYMKRYVVFAAGGFGLINESRQWLMGDGEATANGFIMGMGDQIVSTISLNTIGLNDYQWGRMMRNGVTLTFLESLIPIGIDIPKDMVMDVADAVDGSISGKEGLTAGQRIAYPVAQMPIIKQPARLFSNLEDNIGLPNPMRQFTDKYIETEVPK